MKIGHITPNWKDRFKSLSYKNVTYTNEVSLIDSNDFDRYNIGMGYCKDGIREIFEIDNSFTNLKNMTYAIHKISPGQVLPIHVDRYLKYSAAFNITDISKIERVIVFLEDWCPGHILQVETTMHSNWKAGDWVSWTGEVPHLAANLGHTDRYTLQITGHL